MKANKTCNNIIELFWVCHSKSKAGEVLDNAHGWGISEIEWDLTPTCYWGMHKTMKNYNQNCCRPALNGDGTWRRYHSNHTIIEQWKTNHICI